MVIGCTEVKTVFCLLLWADEEHFSHVQMPSSAPEQKEQEVNKHHFYPGCCATQSLTWKPQISICYLIQGNRIMILKITDKRRLVVVSLHAAEEKWWEAHSETEDEGTWRPIRENKVQKLRLNSALRTTSALKSNFLCICFSSQMWAAATVSVRTEGRARWYSDVSNVEFLLYIFQKHRGLCWIYICF